MTHGYPKSSIIEKAFSQAEYAINITDPDGVLVKVNQAYLRLYKFGSEREVLGKRQNVIRSPLTPSSVYRTMWETITSGGTWRGELTNLAKDGSEVFIHLTITPILEEGRIVGYMGFSIDRGQQVLLERQLFHANKLVVLGTLGAGLAHELNNPLTSVLLEAEYLGEVLAQSGGALPDRGGALSAAKSIVASAERMQKVIEHLLLYSRKEQRPEYEPVDVGELLEDSLLFMDKQLRNRGISLSVESVAGKVAVLGNKIQLESVIHNLLTNSRDAFEAGGRSDKIIRIQVRHPEPRLVDIEYTDNAGGIPPEIFGRIFDPFFTTKGEGQGTGLGLSISKKIISEHNGTIHCSSAGGQTRFLIQLPLA